jgi:hypothetical protein
MKKYAALLAVLASLVLAGVASADVTPEGYLYGFASLGTTIETNVGISEIDISASTNPVSDGENNALYIAKKNDKSGDCNGDAGTVTVFYDTDVPSFYAIACAHFISSGQMAFDWFDTHLNTYVVVYIVDTSPVDKVFVGTTTIQTLAMKWVNLGWEGSGARRTPYNRPFYQADPAGNYTVSVGPPPPDR